MNDTKLICKALGGSHLYGLNTTTSDTDIVSIFLNQDIGTIIGLGRHDHNVKIDKKEHEEDIISFEFRHALNMLRRGNTQMIELLFNEKWISIEWPWRHAQHRKYRLIDSVKLYDCIKGYASSEWKLAKGERKGQIGGKRYNAVLAHGYSPKNAVQMLRLLYCAIEFFNHLVFPTDILAYNEAFGRKLLSIKTEPQRWTIDQIELDKLELEKRLDVAFNNRKATYEFDVDLANRLVLDAYSPILNKHFSDHEDDDDVERCKYCDCPKDECRCDLKEDVIVRSDIRLSYE